MTIKRIDFGPLPINQRPLTVNSMTLHHADGRPLLAGEIPEGGTVTFDISTGEVLAIKNPGAVDDQAG
jgi:hypothetical protein